MCMCVCMSCMLMVIPPGCPPWPNHFDVGGVARRSPVTRQAQRARAEPPTDPSALAGDTVFTVGGNEPRYSDYMRELSCGTTLMHSRANGFTLH